MPFVSSSFDKLSTTLGQKFWYGGKAYYPWTHPHNFVPNALMLTLDGCPQYKFQACKNGKLRLVRDYSKGKNSHFKLGLKPLQTITLAELQTKVDAIDHKRSSEYLRKTSPVPVPCGYCGNF